MLGFGCWLLFAGVGSMVGSGGGVDPVWFVGLGLCCYGLCWLEVGLIVGVVDSGWVHDDDGEQEEGMKKMMNDGRMKMMNCDEDDDELVLKKK